MPERRSNSLVVYARKQEMETIARLVEKLDADIYGGQRVFFYFAENTKARDLAATLDAIFGRGSGSTSSSTSPSTTTARSSRATHGLAGLAEPVEHRGIGLDGRTSFGSTGGDRSGPELPRGGGPAGETRFIPDEVTNSIIVTTYPRVWSEIEGIIKKLDRMPRQVLIEVLAAEVTLDDSTSFGLQWALQHGRFAASLTTPPRRESSRARPPDLIPPFGTVAGPRPDSTSSPSRPASSWPPSTRWPRTTRSTCCRARRS